ERPVGDLIEAPARAEGRRGAPAHVLLRDREPEAIGIRGRLRPRRSVAVQIGDRGLCVLADAGGHLVHHLSASYPDRYQNAPRGTSLVAREDPAATPARSPGAAGRPLRRAATLPYACA